MTSAISQFLSDYRRHEAARAALGIPPKPLTAEQTKTVIAALQFPPEAEKEFLLNLFITRIPPGVDEAAQLKASFLSSLIKGETEAPSIHPATAVHILGTMKGGYNIAPLIEALTIPNLSQSAADALSHLVLIPPDAFDKIAALRLSGNQAAEQVMERWASAEWFTTRPELPEKLTLTVFKVPGETNTDDLSPASDAATRPDIPLHANAMLKNPRESLPNALQTLADLKRLGHLVAYVGDVVGTGSSRKSATNSVLWHMGQDIPNVPNRRTGAVIIGTRIAPIFFNTNIDSGALPIRADTSNLKMGDLIDLYPHKGEIRSYATNNLLSTFALAPMLVDAVRAGGRPTLIFGKQLTAKATEALNSLSSSFRRRPESSAERPRGITHPFHASEPASAQSKNTGFTLAQKILGKAIGLPSGQGVHPGDYIEPKITTVGSQDTTGPMTRDELKDLACLTFAADLVMQSFCHTAAYPKPIDKENFTTLTDFMKSRGGIVLNPGDGVIHSWLNRMLLPDTVGTGGDSHTRFPIGISFPGGSDLVAFAAATGVMPLEVPESVLVRFKGKMQPGITLRDIVNAIPYKAAKQGLLTIEKKNKKNIFDGRILEIEGLPDLTPEQAFELTDASAERSAAACTIQLSQPRVEEFLRANLAILEKMVTSGYASQETLKRRIASIKNWLSAPTLLTSDPNATYAATLEIDLSEITEPLLACPNDPDDIKPLSEVAGTKVDEVFIGSCMTNISHFREAATLIKSSGTQSKTKLWIAPPTITDKQQLETEGTLPIFITAGARIETPGCSLCMGNQATAAEGATVVSTSTRNFPNRLGKNTKVYLASSRIAALTATLGRLPTLKEYGNTP